MNRRHVRGIGGVIVAGVVVAIAAASSGSSAGAGAAAAPTTTPSAVTLPALPTVPATTVLAPINVSTVPPTAAQGGTAAPTFDVATFFTQMYAAVSTDPSQLDKLSGFTVPGGVADRWLTYMQYYATATGALSGAPQYVATPAGAGIEVCYVGVTPRINTTVTTTTMVAGPTTLPVPAGSTCATFGDFVIAPDGRLDSFTINGVPLTDRLVSVAPQAFGAFSIDGGAGVKRISDDALLVVVQVSATTDTVSFDWANATYTDPNGQSIPISYDMSGWTAATPPGGTGYVIAVFPGASPGGTIETSAATSTAPAAIQVQIPVTLG